MSTKAAIATSCALGLSVLTGLCLFLAMRNREMPASASFVAEPSASVMSLEGHKETKEEERTQLARPGDMEALAAADSSRSDSYPGFSLKSLGPLDEAALADCTRRLAGMVEMYDRKRREFLAEPAPAENASQDEWYEKVLGAHYKCLKTELAAKALASGEYWVFEPGSRRYPPDIRTIDIFGVKAHGRDNVTVVVPISLTEHPDLQRQGADWEEFVRYRSRLFAQEFNSRSYEARVAAIALHDGVGKRLEELNARGRQNGLTEDEVARIDAERAGVLRAMFPMYCFVDRERQTLYVTEQGR